MEVNNNNNVQSKSLFPTSTSIFSASQTPFINSIFQSNTSGIGLPDESNNSSDNEAIIQFEKYRASLSPEERVKFDSEKKQLLSTNTWSKLTQSETVQEQQLFDTTDLQQDGKIGSFRQGTRSDCSLLASLMNLSSDPENAQVLSDSLENNGDGTYTVTFKGEENYTKQRLDEFFQNGGREKLQEKLKGLQEDQKYLETHSALKGEEDYIASVANHLDFSSEDEKKEFINTELKKVQSTKESIAKEMEATKAILDETQTPEQQSAFIDKKAKELSEITVTEQELDNNVYDRKYGRPSMRFDKEKKSFELQTYSVGDKDVRIFEIARDKMFDELNLIDEDPKDDNTSNAAAQRILLNKDVQEIKIADDDSAKTVQEKQSQLIEAFENNPPSKLTVGSMQPPQNADIKDFTVTLKDSSLGEREIDLSHAYNLKSVDKESKTVTLTSSRETEQDIPLSYDEFLKYYNYASVINRTYAAR